MASSNSNLMPYDAVLFDFDGVLFDSEPLHFECWRDVLATVNLRLEWPEYLAHLGWADKEFIERFCAVRSVPFESAWSEYPRKQELFLERLRANQITPDLKQLLQELQTRMKIAVVTSSSRHEVEPMLVSQGVRDYFEATVCSEDVTRRKPDPEPYLTAAKLLAANRPLVVEDSPVGVKSAQAAGFDVIVIPNAADTARLTRQTLDGN